MWINKSKTSMRVTLSKVPWSSIYAATHCNTLQHTATHCNKSKTSMRVTLSKVPWSSVYATTHCNTLQHIETHCNTPQHIATHCNTSTGPLRGVARNSIQGTSSIYVTTHCNSLQLTATHCNTHVHTTSSQVHYNTWQHTEYSVT